MGFADFEHRVKEYIPDKETRDYLGRFCFYALTGLNNQDTLLINYGSGANGKSAFWEAFSYMMGGFYRRPNPALLSGKKRDPNGHDAALDYITGGRLLFFEEAGGQDLNPMVVKDLVAAAEISVRGHDKSETNDVKMVSKLVMNTNSRPSYKADGGINRRLAVMHWDQKFENPDPSVRDELKQMPTQILNWTLSYREDFWTRGVKNKPPQVDQLTNEVIMENDPYMFFGESYCSYEPGTHATASELSSGLSILGIDGAVSKKKLEDFCARLNDDVKEFKGKDIKPILDGRQWIIPGVRIDEKITAKGSR